MPFHVSASRQNGARGLCAAALVAVACAANAATAQSVDSHWSGQSGASSQYVGKGLGGSAGDLDLNGTLEASHGGWRARLHACNMGVKYNLSERWSIDARWYDADSRSPGETYDRRLVGALSFNF